jgi:hypothetical protein
VTDPVEEITGLLVADTLRSDLKIGRKSRGSSSSSLLNIRP